MKQAKLIADRDYVVDQVDERLYGSFAEHLGRVVYTGIFEPNHPSADENGFRRDVIDLVKELGISIVRYPGGNFVSGYDWTDGIGPTTERPRRLDLAWRVKEDNKFGIDEFSDWAKKANVEFMATVNLGTGTPKEAGQMIEYTNHPGGTYWSDLRRKNGHEHPHNIRVWCLGNEMDGEWQIGAMSADDYGKKARETSKIMRWVDSDIELVVCGSCTPEMPTYPDWDRIVLEHTYDVANHISLHRYYSYDPERQMFFPNSDNQSDVPFFPVDLQNYLDTVLAAADLVKAKKGAHHRVSISFDEWGVLSCSNPIPKPRPPWQDPTEDSTDTTFNLLDALIYGAILCTFIRNADRVKIANQSLLVNAGGMISTKKGGPARKNTTFYPFQHVAKYGKGTAIHELLDCHKLTTDHHGEAPALQTAVVYNEAEEILNVFLVNFDPEHDVELSLDCRSFGRLEPVEHIILHSENLWVTNSYEQPNRLRPQHQNLEFEASGKDSVVIGRSSWNVLRLRVLS